MMSSIKTILSSRYLAIAIAGLCIFNTEFLFSQTNPTNSESSFTPHLTKDIISPVYPSLLKVNETYIEPTTGLKITRLTDSETLEGTNDAFVSYSRYSPENSSGELFLAFGTNSSSSWVINRKTGKTVAKLLRPNGKTIGEYHEIRWDNSGKFPNRLYYRDGMRLMKIDDVYKHEKTTSIIKDFSKEFPKSKLIYNDVEGDSSNDSDHWAFMAAHYNGKTNVVDAFIHYQISTDTTHSLTTKQLAETDLGHYAAEEVFPRPNMVEVSPNGDGIVIHYSRAWGDAEYGHRYKDKRSWFDGPHLWPLDFDFKKVTPKKISVSSTHSGWSFDDNGNSYFVSQNNRNDYIEAMPLNGHRSIRIGSHRDMGWSNGFHFGKMPTTKPNWSLVSTYSKNQNNGEKLEWAANQIFFLELKPFRNSNRVLRIGPTYNKYDGNYRDEAIAAINLAGNRIYFSSNWGGQIKHREIFVYELPDNWQEMIR